MSEAFADSTSAEVAQLQEINRQLEALEAKLAASLEEHPDAAIYLSMPGMGIVLGARVLGEFGDDPERVESAKSRRNYAGTSPLTRASGRRRAVTARFVRNRRLYDPVHMWAFCSLQASPGCRAYYRRRRRSGTGTTRRCAPSATAWSATRTAACAHASSTTRRPPGESQRRRHRTRRLTSVRDESDASSHLPRYDHGVSTLAGRWKCASAARRSPPSPVARCSPATSAARTRGPRCSCSTTSSRCWAQARRATRLERARAGALRRWLHRRARPLLAARPPPSR